MNWCHREPTLNGILSDPVVRAVMEADGVNRHELEVMLRPTAEEFVMPKSKRAIAAGSRQRCGMITRSAGQRWPQSRWVRGQ